MQTSEARMTITAVFRRAEPTEPLGKLPRVFQRPSPSNHALSPSLARRVAKDAKDAKRLLQHSPLPPNRRECDRSVASTAAAAMETRHSCRVARCQTIYSGRKLWLGKTDSLRSVPGGPRIATVSRNPSTVTTTRLARWSNLFTRFATLTRPSNRALSPSLAPPSSEGCKILRRRHFDGTDS